MSETASVTDRTNALWLEQLTLPGTLPPLPESIDGVPVVLIRDYLTRLNVLEAQMAELRESLNDVRTEMRDKGLPVKSIAAALRIVRAKSKATDGSAELLAVCIALASNMVEKEAQEVSHATDEG